MYGRAAEQKHDSHLDRRGFAPQPRRKLPHRRKLREEDRADQNSDDEDQSNSHFFNESALLFRMLHIQATEAHSKKDFCGIVAYRSRIESLEALF